MIQNLTSINNYGVFVWLSFIITIVACILFYYKTYKTLKKYEMNFANEFNKLSASEKRLILKKSKIATQVLASYSKSI